MAFAVRYTGTYPDASGQTVTVDLLKDGFAGAALPLTLGAPPLVLKTGTDAGDPLKAVHGKEVVIRVHEKSRAAVEDLYSAVDQRRNLTASWRLRASIGGAGSPGIPFFEGPLVLEGYEASDDLVGDGFELRAICGLGDLREKAVAVTVEEAEALLAEGPLPLIEWLRRALAQTGAALPIETACAYEDTTMGSEADPLAEARAHARRFVSIEENSDEEDGEVVIQKSVSSLSWWQVLEAICSPQIAHIAQHPRSAEDGGLCWRYVALECFREDSAAFFRYDEDGTPDGSYEAAARVELQSGEERRSSLEGRRRRRRQGQKAVRVDYAHGEGESLLSQPDLGGVWSQTNGGYGSDISLMRRITGGGLDYSDRLWFVMPMARASENPFEYASTHEGLFVAAGTPLLLHVSAFVPLNPVARRAGITLQPFQVRYRIKATGLSTGAVWYGGYGEAGPAWTTSPLDLSFVWRQVTGDVKVSFGEEGPLPALDENATIEVTVFAGYDPNPLIPIHGVAAGIPASTIQIGEIEVIPYARDGSRNAGLTAYVSSLKGEPRPKDPESGYPLLLGSGPTALHPGCLTDAGGAPLIAWRRRTYNTGAGVPLQTFLPGRLLRMLRREQEELHATYLLQKLSAGEPAQPWEWPSPVLALMDDGSIMLPLSSALNGSLFAGTAAVVAVQLRGDALDLDVYLGQDPSSGFFGALPGGAGSALGAVFAHAAETAALGAGWAFTAVADDWDPVADGSPVPVEAVGESSALMETGKVVMIHNLAGGIIKITLSEDVLDGDETLAFSAYEWFSPPPPGVAKVLKGSPCYAVGNDLAAVIAANKKAIEIMVRDVGDAAPVELGTLQTALVSGVAVTGLSILHALTHTVRIGTPVTLVDDEGTRQTFTVSTDTAVVAGVTSSLPVTSRAPTANVATGRMVRILPADAYALTRWQAGRIDNTVAIGEVISRLDQEAQGFTWTGYYWKTDNFNGVVTLVGVVATITDSGTAGMCDTNSGDSVRNSGTFRGKVVSGNVTIDPASGISINPFVPFGGPDLPPDRAYGFTGLGGLFGVVQDVGGGSTLMRLVLVAESGVQVEIPAQTKIGTATPLTSENGPLLSQIKKSDAFTNDVPVWNGVAWVPTNKANHNHDAGAINSGLMNAARLGTGTPNATTFLRGDGTWSTGPTGPQGPAGPQGPQGAAGVGTPQTAYLNGGAPSPNTYGIGTIVMDLDGPHNIWIMADDGTGVPTARQLG